MRAVRDWTLRDLWQRLSPLSAADAWDWVAPLCMAVLATLGVMFIYSAQAYVEGGAWKMQIVWLGVGLMVYLVMALTDYGLWMRLAPGLYLAGLLLLLMIWTPLGEAREGARRWLDLGVMAYQPAEAAKVSTLILLASVLARSEFDSWRESLLVLVKAGLVVGLPMILIFLQPDLGTCLTFPPMVLALLYVSRFSQRFFYAVFACALLATGLLAWDLHGYKSYLLEHKLTAFEARGQYQVTTWFPLRDYQRERLMGFLDPAVVDPEGTGAAWNANQAQLAVGTGGLMGKGWTQGLQAQLGYLPRSVAHNDFVFAVLAEETGFLGGITVIGLFAILIGNGVRIAAIARDRFGMLLCVGVTILLLLHVFVNVGMSVGITPIKGIPLPFVSYGGSFILTCSVLLGIVQSIYRHRRSLP